MNSQSFQFSLIAVASRKSLSADTNSSAFAVAVHSLRLLRTSKHYLRVMLSMSQIASLVQRCTPRVGLYIGMFARVIVTRLTLDTFLLESGFKKRLEPLMASHLSFCLTQIPLLHREIFRILPREDECVLALTRKPRAHPGRR